MHGFAIKLLRYFAIGLGKSEDYFDPWFKNECGSTFRAIHYKPRIGTFTEKKGNIENEDLFNLVTPEHADSGFITLLTTFMFEGLEVEINGKYEKIKPLKNAIIVNIGNMLERISNNKIKATMHRVRDIGVERYSCPFFFDPKYSARISPNHLKSTRKSCEDNEYEAAEEN